jgi:hypothetical protein
MCTLVVPVREVIGILRKAGVIQHFQREDERQDAEDAKGRRCDILEVLFAAHRSAALTLDVTFSVLF